MGTTPILMARAYGLPPDYGSCPGSTLAHKMDFTINATRKMGQEYPVSLIVLNTCKKDNSRPLRLIQTRK